MIWRSIGPCPYSLWHAVISDAEGPSELASREAYDAAGEHSALALSFLFQESKYGTAFNRNSPGNKNPLNLRPPEGNGYLWFGSWVDGVRAWSERVTSSTYKQAIYANTRTLADLIHVYSPDSDNHPGQESEYVRTIETLLDRWGVSPKEDPSMPELRIILNPGHRNSTGGNEEERQMTPALAQSYFKAFSAAGYETVNLGDTNGGLDETCRRMAAQIASAPGECVLLDLHYEGSPAPGVFCIVPDVTGLRTNANVQQDPADTWENNTKDRALAREISQRIAIFTVLQLRRGIREPGIMDESETGVGADGWRLATFAYTSPYRAKAVRLVVEHGNHTVQPDRSLIFTPDFTDKCASAAVSAVKAVYGDTITPKPQPTPVPVEPVAKPFPEFAHGLATGTDQYGTNQYGEKQTYFFTDRAMTVRKGRRVPRYTELGTSHVAMLDEGAKIRSAFIADIKDPATGGVRRVLWDKDGFVYDRSGFTRKVEIPVYLD